MRSLRYGAAALCLLALQGCNSTEAAKDSPTLVTSAIPPHSGNALDGLIAQYAAEYQVPESLVRRVVKRESNFNPAARNGPNLGLMQIRHDTARTMGFRGEASGLFDAETNLKYAVKYLRGAYLVADGDHDRAVRFYSSGYYYDAKRKGLLVETGLRPG
jgi:soluble lytic murein transglycosylase-like protein